jgi:hypothetical protein
MLCGARIASTDLEIVARVEIKIIFAQTRKEQVNMVCGNITLMRADIIAQVGSARNALIQKKKCCLSAQDAEQRWKEVKHLRLIDADKLIAIFQKKFGCYSFMIARQDIDLAPTVNAIPVDDVAKMLADLFGDCIACNYNDIDQYIEIDCEKDACPDYGDYSCWKKYVMYLMENERAKMDGGEQDA